MSMGRLRVTAAKVHHVSIMQPYGSLPLPMFAARCCADDNCVCYIYIYIYAYAGMQLLSLHNLQHATVQPDWQPAAVLF